MGSALLKLYLSLFLSRAVRSPLCWPWRSHLYKLQARHAVVNLCLWNEATNGNGTQDRSASTGGGAATASKDCGGGSISAPASTGGSATSARTAAAQWHPGSASTGGSRQLGRLRSVCKDCTQTTHSADFGPLGVVDHLQKVVDHTLASREKREWSTTLVRMVDHPRQPVKKLWLVAGRDHPRVERMVDHPRRILIFCILLTRSSVYMSAQLRIYIPL